MDHRHVFGHFLGQAQRDPVIFCSVFRSIQTRQVVQEQHRIGRFDLAPGAFDADLLDRVHAGQVAFAQAGGVDHMQRHTLDLDQSADLVAGGAGNRRDDGQLGASQCVQQRAFTRHWAGRQSPP
jgi:hypothetical protein